MNRILVIDDKDQSDFMESLKDRAHELTQVETEVIQLDKAIPQGLQNNETKPIVDELDKYLTAKLDLVLCDINLNAEFVALPLIIADHIRKKNKGCHIILYSGGLHKILEDLLELKSTSKGKEVEKPVRALLTAGIAEMVERDKIEDRALHWISRPSLLLQLERKLLEYPNYRFQSGYPKFEGLTFGGVAKEVREQTANGIKFTEEIFEQTLAQMIAINK